MGNYIDIIASLDLESILEDVLIRDIEAAILDARNEGYDDGYGSGYEQGYSSGTYYESSYGD